MLLPQPKKIIRRKRNELSGQPLEQNIHQGWNGVIKNISGAAVTKAEENLLSRGKKFCPIQLDPPVVRIQKELDIFFRNLRIQWIFQNQPDRRSELEKTFYQKSNWEPPKACSEIENMIQKIQDQFDKWSPPHWIKDNLPRNERNFLNSVKDNNEIVYMWEDKGGSFTKMTRNQYIAVGEKELEANSYSKVTGDPCQKIKTENDQLVSHMQARGEIPDKVAAYLLNGEKKMSKFYHLLKTHKISPNMDNPAELIESGTLPVRGIISAIKSPLERLGGFVDYFLKPGMQDLPTFIQDTKHVLQIIEELNTQIDKGEVSLDGVGLVALDIESMYSNMSEELGNGASKQFLESRNGRGGTG